MPDDNPNPPVSVDNTTSSFVDNIMGQFFDTPEDSTELNVQPDGQVQIAQVEATEPTEIQEPEPTEIQEPEPKKVAEETETKPKASQATGKAFADMRIKLRSAEKENKELKERLEALEHGSNGDNSGELEKLRSIVNGYAFTETEEYKQEVATPFAKVQAKLSELVASVDKTLHTENLDAMNDIVFDDNLDEYDKDEAYEKLASDLGLEDMALMKFVRMAKLRESLIHKHAEYKEKAKEYVDKFMANAKGTKSYEVNLDNYVLDKMQARAKELGLNTEITEDHLKKARHFAHKIENGSFMDAILAKVAQEELKKAREEIEALNTKISKLRGVTPKASKGSTTPPDSKNGKRTKHGNTNDIIENMFNL